MRLLLALPLSLLLAAGPGERRVSDAALAALARSPVDQTKAFKTEVLGVNHGKRVTAAYPCSDLCPDETRRIISYDLAPGPACEKAGGVTMALLVPRGPAVMTERFCLPRAVAAVTKPND